MRFGFFTRLGLAAYSACQPPLTPSLAASSLSVSPALTVTVLPETAGVVFAGLAAGLGAVFGAAGAAFGVVVVIALGAVRVVERDVDGAAAAAVAAPPLALVRPARGPQTGHAVGPLVARIRWATAICCSRVAWYGSAEYCVPPKAAQ